MIEELLTTIANTLVSEGGGWMIAVALAIVIYIMDKRITKAKRGCDDDLKDQYEKRLIEFRQVLDTLGTSTQSINAMQSSVLANSEAMNGLAQAFAKMLQEFQGQQDLWGNRAGVIEKQLDDIQRRVENLRRGRAA